MIVVTTRIKRYSDKYRARIEASTDLCAGYMASKIRDGVPPSIGFAPGGWVGRYEIRSGKLCNIFL